MAAFDRVECGIQGLDQAFDNIRLGDNVVWQLSKLEDFSLFVKPYIRQAIADKRNLIYIRFASHPELLPPMEGVTRYELDPRAGFEPFTVEVRSIITKEGRDAFYVFDCLSELQVAWSSDLMMGNFFRVTCPYLFQLDTVAYFPILRGRHSFSAVAKIRDTTQLLIDVYAGSDAYYIHPLKVWNRYSPTMFLAHGFDPQTGTVHTLTDAVEMSRYYACVNDETRSTGERNIDSWDRFFLDAKMRFQQGALDETVCTKMCNMMMTKDPRMRALVKRFFAAEDYFEVRNKMIGTGLIGGKSCGMLLARKIVEKELPELAPMMEPHDSFYIGTDVFYSFLVANDLWKLRIAQRDGEGFIDAAPDLAQGIRQGVFPEDVREGFCRVLDYYGQTPIIVRSSSFLEDGFDNAFAGKYESVFCANVGEFDDRLREFEDAVRTVYASMMDRSALEYRRRNGLDASEEQMSLLVQRVSGSLLSNGCFMPTAAGVGYSHSAYCWMPGMDADAGMLRLVAGLGTKAVDRTARDYPRIVSLDRPRATTASTPADKHRYSQRFANVIDLNTRAFSEVECAKLADVMAADGVRAVFEHDYDAERTLRERGRFRPVLFASCEGLVANETFTGAMRSIMRVLQTQYDYPVDIEFTVNVGAGGTFVINLLQCRPLQSLSGKKHVVLPQLAQDKTLFSVENAAMGNARAAGIDAAVYVDPKRYYETPYVEKPLVASAVGAAADALAAQGATMLLLAPGRIGTSSPELGVPVTFADIEHFEGVCEMAYSGAGYSPELSYGSHMFQDLVEANIYYGAIAERDGRLGVNVRLLEGFDEMSLPDQVSNPNGAVSVYLTGARKLTLWHDALENRSVCGLAD